MCSSKELSHTAVKGGNTFGIKRVQPIVLRGDNTIRVKEEQSLGTRVNQEGVMNNLTATKSALSDLRSGSKGLSPIAVGGNMGWVNAVDIVAESVANSLGKSWSQVVNTNVQHKGLTLDHVAPCMKEG
ncbi:hypothetical protein F0562_013404 [Nyssa sinensis]|uniref:Uncharacterized protein n=1 Tax=Nyssa sinensis TaxID=561372 RepID=A0A5J4ZNS2_9ASTE|nr:hypothetical protein F0562_013404 [Nyssa sinensis]